MGQIGLDTLLASMGRSPQMQNVPTYFHAPQVARTPNYQQQIIELLNKPVNYQAQMNALRPMIEAAYKPQIDYYNSLLARASNQNPLLSAFSAFGRGFNAAARNPYQPGWAAALQGASAYGTDRLLEQQRADLIRRRLAEAQGKQATSLMRMVAPMMRPLSPATKINALTALNNNESATKRWQAEEKRREARDERLAANRAERLALDKKKAADSAEYRKTALEAQRAGKKPDKSTAKLEKLLESKGNAISRGLDKIASDPYLEEDQRKQPEKLEDRIKWFNALPDSIKAKYRTVARTIKKYTALRKKYSSLAPKQVDGKKIPAEEAIKTFGAQ